MTTPVLICILALALAVVILTVISSFQSKEISELKNFKTGTEEDIRYIENNVNFHDARLSANVKSFRKYEEELKKLEIRIHTLEMNQDVKYTFNFNNEK